MNDAMKLLCKVGMLVILLLLTTVGVNAQSLLSGTVVDQTNEPIIGATVIEKGNPKNAAATDLEGNFKLKVAAGKKIVVSYIGMVSQEVVAQNGMKITLKEEDTALEEVVVVGYTSKARKDLTGSVGSVSGQKLAIVPTASAAEALQGKIAGVQVTTVDGQPGADINIRVRGATSVTQNNDPLFIVDGFQQDNINDIPPSDIASIDVLKDASLTAIYGAKGGNGVVVVTTKSAQQGKVKVDFNGRLTVAHLAKKLDLMSTYDFVDYQYDRAAANGNRSSWAKSFRGNFGNPQDIDIYRRAVTHDWQDEVMGETPVNYSANINIGGGNEKLRFNTSITQTDDRGIIMGSGVRRTNIDIKLFAQLTKNLQLTYSPKMNYRRDTGAGGDNVGSGGIVDVLRYRPTNGLREFAYWDERVVDADEEANFAYTNPKSDIQTNVQKKHQYSINNRVALQWTPIKNLVLRTEGNYAITFRDTERYYGPLTSTAKSTVHNSLPLATTTERHTEAYTWTNTANYSFDIKDVHNLSFLLGQEIYNSQYKEQSQTNHLFPRSVTAEKAFDNMTLGVPYASTSELSTPNRTASFFGQASYNYDHKYLVSVTMRADGSSRFAPGNQWGYFPSISGAWVINKEKFLKDVEWIDQLKLRVAYGLSGNNRISDDLWRYLYQVKNTGGPGFGEITNDGEMSYSVSSYPNKDIKWETTITRNLAFDISLFKSRLTITPEFYWNTTRDLLYTSPIATTSGYSSQMQNIGKVKNTGFDLTVSGDIVRGKDYVVSGTFTLGKNKTIVKELNASDKNLYKYTSRWSSTEKEDYLLQVGGELGQMYGYVYDGLYKASEFSFDVNSSYVAVPWSDENPHFDENGNRLPNTVVNTVLNSSNSGAATLPGKIKFKDLNGDGVIDKNDRTVIGNTNPRVQGGFGLNGRWKDFDFAVNFTYMLDFDVYNATAYALSSSSSSQYNFYNVLSKYAGNNRWRYTRKGDGEAMYKNTYIDGALEEYLSMNANANLWNPADVTNNVMNSYFVEDGSFLRCTDLTVGYTLPGKLIKKYGISKLRVYASASNLFILTGYSGYDPEIDIQSGLTPSMDYNRYPRNRAFSLGVNVSF